MRKIGPIRTKPINIYALSRIHEEIPFNIVKKHRSQQWDTKSTGAHEIESLNRFVESLLTMNISLDECDGFFYCFQIPQIGKEFDLLKFTDNLCLNVELKSFDVPKERILSQLLKNRYYLSHLGKDLAIYSVITDSMSCYKLSRDKELVITDISEIVSFVHEIKEDYYEYIDSLFRASDYLVSPLNTPSRFVEGEYFLTQQQEEVKKQILCGINTSFSKPFFHITGKPGTGKTLLIYDIARTLSTKGNTIIIHCGILPDSKLHICSTIRNLDIISVSQLRSIDFSFSNYKYILIDESHRIYTNQFNTICESVRRYGQICVFSSDPGQVLSSLESKSNIVSKIDALPLGGNFALSEKIRTNQELQSFIMCMQDLNHKSRIHMDYSNVEINYANTIQEARNLLEYYRSIGYVFINYSKSNYEHSPFTAYTEDFDTHHVIGQEFDKVVMLLDQSFYYDNEGILRAHPHPNPNYLYPNLLYQGVTRAREQLALIVVNTPDLFNKVISIVTPVQN